MVGDAACCVYTDGGYGRDAKFCVSTCGGFYVRMWAVRESKWAVRESPLRGM